MGVIAASGTITQLIPPSLVLIVLADQLGTLGRRHVCRRDRPEHHPGRAVLRLGVDRSASSGRRTCRRCRRKRARCTAGRCWKQCLRGIVPSIGLIFLVLGTIFLGLATPTEAGAMGVVGALLLALVLRPR